MTQNEVNKLICIGWDLDKFFTVKTKKVFTGYGWRGKNDEIITISLEDAMNNEIETADLEKKYKVVRKEEKFNDIPILAESKEDFHFILEREAKRLNVPIETVAEHQSEPVRKMWRERKNIYKNDGLELSPEFIEYQMRIDGFLDYCNKIIEKVKHDISAIPDFPESMLIDLMESHFEKMGKNGWMSAFNSEKDYKEFILILHNFFNNEPYDIENLSIKLKRKTKTMVASVLRDIHKDLSERALKSDENFFQIVKVLSPFSDESNDKIYKALNH